MLHSNHYQKDKEFRSRRMAEVGREHLAGSVMTRSKPFFNMGITLRTHRVLAGTVLLVGLLVITVLVMPGITHASDNTADNGSDGQPFSEAMRLYRVGHYYFVTGNYDRAIEDYTNAIGEIPSEVFSKSADYAAMYWELGDAQLKNAQYDDALTSYQDYLDLVGDQASTKTVAYVQSLQDAIVNGTTAEVSLITG